VRGFATAAALLLLAAPVSADEAEPTDDAGVPEETIEIIESLPPPGSSQIVGKKELERFARDDVHKALASVPGVYIRQEDGYGLRPNIGMRGAASERSAKIALLEDDVLIAPAPYSAPAAYYFPLMARMVSMEVTKGPSAIAYGPNTVGGALNLTTKLIPMEREIVLDVAGGSDLYGKLHASYGESWNDVGVLIEAVKLRSDGFKHLDGGGSTGFDKNDLMLKLKGRAGKNDLTLKAAYNDEVSHETYTGLSDADFAVDPYRRYAGTALDQFDAWHTQLQAGHLFTWSTGSLTTTGYRNDFSRQWNKLNGFRGRRDLAEILAHPDAGNNSVYHAVLAGEQDSTSDAEALMIGTNARRFTSQGVQTTLKLHSGWWGLPHSTEVGLRLHHDLADRLHDEEGYRMTGGTLERDATPRMITLDATGSALALAAYARHQVRLGPVQLTAGVRTEMVWTTWEDHADPSHDSHASYSVIIPGGGVVWQATPWLGLLAGVHKGFVPVAPGEEDGANPEESVNYEAGARAGNGWWQAEVIGFFSDYSNLKGTCSFSAGCDAQHLDMEYNGGRVFIAGTEARGAITPRFGAWSVPRVADLHLQLVVVPLELRFRQPRVGRRRDRRRAAVPARAPARALGRGAERTVGSGGRHALRERDARRRRPGRGADRRSHRGGARPGSRRQPRDASLGAPVPHRGQRARFGVDRVAPPVRRASGRAAARRRGLQADVLIRDRVTP
jgi:Fe(3+) dicitrate transport protein